MKISIIVDASRTYLHLSSIVILTIYLLSTGDRCMAQYHPFPIEDGVWVNNEKHYYIDENFQPVYTSDVDYKYCANGSDTLINSIIYKQIDNCFSSSSNFHGAMRYENGRVYFVPKDSLDEFLLYDFTVNAGNTVTVIHQNDFGFNPSYQLYETYINYVDTVVVNGTLRRRLFTEGYDWIEGIGSTSGLFMEPWINVSNYSRSLICLGTNDTLHYHNGVLEMGEPGICDFTLSTQKLIQNPRNSQVFPNPARTQMSLTNAEDYDRLRIMNVAGQEVSSITVSKGQTTINVPVVDLRNGMYLLQAYSGQQLMTSIRFVKD